MKADKVKSNIDKFSGIILSLLKNLIRALIMIITLCLLLGSISLIYDVYLKMAAPPFLLLEADTLLNVFRLVLIAVVGFELVKSLTLIISSDRIPFVQIIEISIIAVVNKVITLEIADIDIILSLAALIVALGILLFFSKYKSS